MIICFPEGCPDGFFNELGDIGGSGQIGGGIKTTMAGCGKECTRTPACCSFEFSYTSQLCNLNSDCFPSLPPYLDYYFCTKHSEFGEFHDLESIGIIQKIVSAQCHVSFSDLVQA